jgi:hypothetical protein
VRDWCRSCGHHARTRARALRLSGVPARERRSGLLWCGGRAECGQERRLLVLFARGHEGPRVRWDVGTVAGLAGRCGRRVACAATRPRRLRTPDGHALQRLALRLFGTSPVLRASAARLPTGAIRLRPPAMANPGCATAAPRRAHHHGDLPPRIRGLRLLLRRGRSIGACAARPQRDCE